MVSTSTTTGGSSTAVQDVGSATVFFPTIDNFTRIYTATVTLTQDALHSNSGIQFLGARVDYSITELNP